MWMLQAGDRSDRHRRSAGSGSRYGLGDRRNRGQCNFGHRYAAVNMQKDYQSYIVHFGMRQRRQKQLREGYGRCSYSPLWIRYAAEAR